MIAAVIRPATGDEAPAAAEVFLAARRAMEDIAPMIHSADETRRWMREVVFREHDVALAGAIMDGRIAGMMATRPGWIDHLYIHPDFQGRGLGTALLHDAQRGANGAFGLQLWTFQANAGARRFYARHGFVEVLFTDGSANEERIPDVKLAWAP